MALPDYFKIEPGTAIIWGQPSATGVTKDLTLDALADGTAREGVYADLGAQFDEEYSVQLIIETGTAPAAGARADLYLVCADATTRFPAGLTGADAAWPGDSSEDEWCAQLGAPVISLIATADANTIQRTPAIIWRPAARYVCCVVDNNLGQAIRDETTATDNDSRVVLVPRRLLVQDAA
jgi:hypothetical protein